MSKVTFRIPSGGSDQPTDPESLFHDLKNRAPDIQALWSHQADLLRVYAADHKTTQDVALELPTGTGKTLVGLLIAEYRRRAHGDRVVYLCPTRQLAHQVGIQARNYGISAAPILRPNYDGINDYRLSRQVAITTYSSLFNVKPRFDDPQTVVMDDAHAAEGFIASMWSLEIRRQEQEKIYGQLIQLIAHFFDKTFVDTLNDDSPDPFSRMAVDLLPFTSQHTVLAAITGLLDSQIAADAPERFPWSTIRQSLHACGVYVSWHSILIRPLIPPTMTHSAFAQASQRVYMSATLGEGGELERLTGVREIARLPAPGGWEKHTAGRRLFLLPGLSMESADARQVAIQAVKQAGRALVLAPRGDVVTSFRSDLEAAGVPVLGAEDIEASMDSFTQQDSAALVLANRYDGIDLPGDTCRLLILVGQCVGAHLMERFLLSRLRATNLLRDRIRTRFTQGVGRCCRGTTDFAVVFLLEQDLIDFCLRADNRSMLHPELQAELEFGFDNSEKQTADAIIELVKMFLARDPAWNDAEKALTALRAKKTKRLDPLSEQLRRVVAREVDYVYALWRKDYDSAVVAAQHVSDNLNGADFEGYRAWWYYHGGVAAWLNHQERHVTGADVKARDLFTRAMQASKLVSWFTRIANQGDPAAAKNIDADTTSALERVLNALERLGLHGKKFEEAVTECTRQLRATDAKQFEMGLENLGKLIGFDAIRPNEDAAPDGIWKLGEHFGLVFEAKSDQSPDGPVSLTDVRQARTHAEWVRSKQLLGEAAELVTLVVTPRRTIDDNAKTSAGDLRYFHIDELRTLFDRAAACLRRIRSGIASTDDAQALQLITAQFTADSLMPRDVASALIARRLGDLPGPA